MTSKERFFATVERREIDRPATWLGLPHPKSLPEIYRYFGVSDMRSLKSVIGDDVYPVEMPYHSPVSDSISSAFDFASRGKISVDERTLTAKGYFCGCEDISKVESFGWDEPTQYISASECAELTKNIPEDKAVLGVIWSAHFQNTCAAFGMEDAFVAMLETPEIYKAIDEKIVEFYLKANESFYEKTNGKLDAVLIGNDMGSQLGLMLSPDLIREFVIPGAKRLIKQAHSYGLKVIYHSCGAISEIIPDLVAAGADVIHPIQALAAGMSAETLCEKFGGKVSFCGGVDTQQLLSNGSPDDVKRRVNELKVLFPTGLIISPSHEALLPDVSPANIEAMFS